MTESVPATTLTDRTWLADDLIRAQHLYGPAPDRVLGTIRWYSASSVLVAPALEPLVLDGAARDPALHAVTFDMHPDGRYVDAHSDRILGADLSTLAVALGTALQAAVTAIADVSGAPHRSLWAIAADSIANRILWAGSAAGDTGRAAQLAQTLIRETGHGMPHPRFVLVGNRPVLRRSSCCLIYQTPLEASEKCVSCPRQTPAERARRLHDLLG